MGAPATRPPVGRSIGQSDTICGPYVGGASSRAFGFGTTFYPTVVSSGGGVSVTSDIQAVTLLASVPLTDEDWQPLPKNTILALSQGEVVARA